MSLTALSVIACVLATVGLVEAERRASHRGRFTAKPLASAAFVVAAATADLSPIFARALFAGLVLSALGDVLLMGADHPRHGPRFFLAGLGSFLLAHVAYVVAFAARGLSPFAVEGAALPLLVALVAVLAWLLPKVPPPMRGPVFAYALVISAMVALAVGTFAAHGGRALLAGALLFYASDLAVARDQFVARAFVNRAWGLPAYYAAQLLLVASLH